MKKIFKGILKVFIYTVIAYLLYNSNGNYYGFSFEFILFTTILVAELFRAAIICCAQNNCNYLIQIGVCLLVIALFTKIIGNTLDVSREIVAIILFYGYLLKGSRKSTLKAFKKMMYEPEKKNPKRRRNYND